MSASKQEKHNNNNSNNKPSTDQQHKHKHQHQQQHNLLLPYLSQETPLGRHVLHHIENDGYVVLPAIFTPSECAIELDRLWNFIEATSPSVKRDHPASWYPNTTVASSSSEETSVVDPWPHSGWKFLPDMCQSYQAGWLFSSLREKLADRVFEPLYGTRELHSSKEGFTFHRPLSIIDPSPSEPTTPKKLLHPFINQTKPFVCNKPTHTHGEHFDQRASHTGLHCIQSSTALLDQTPAIDGSFLCWPRSHKEHSRMTEGIWRGRSDWVPLTDGECEELRERGYGPRRVPVNRGDVILWRSDLVHCGVGPTMIGGGGVVDGFRAVSYTCMLPASLTPEDVRVNKLKEYVGGLSGDHRPNVKMAHLSVPKKKGKTKHKTTKGEELEKPTMACDVGSGGGYFKGGLPALTMRQAELYGLVPYNNNNNNTVSDGEGVACRTDTEVQEEERQWVLSVGGN